MAYVIVHPTLLIQRNVFLSFVYVVNKLVEKGRFSQLLCRKSVFFFRYLLAYHFVHFPTVISDNHCTHSM